MRAEVRAVLFAVYEACTAASTARSSLRRSSQGISGIAATFSLTVRGLVALDERAPVAGKGLGRPEMTNSERGYIVRVIGVLFNRIEGGRLAPPLEYTERSHRIPQERRRRRPSG